jgi:Phage tail tube protein, GTA-gp10
VTGINPLRGEVALVLASRTLRLRPSYAALVATEQDLGSLFALIERAGTGAATLADISGLLWHCLDPRPADLTRDAFGQALIDEGLATATAAFRALLEAALAGSTA